MGRGDGATRVFISSAYGCLAPYRAAAVDVCHRLELVPVHMEEFRPEAPPPVQVCRRRVDEADVFVLVVAHRYGARPPGEPLAFTELEYLRARERDLPIHAFVVDPGHPWRPADIDHGEDAAALRRHPPAQPALPDLS